MSRAALGRPSREAAHPRSGAVRRLRAARRERRSPRISPTARTSARCSELQRLLCRRAASISCASPASGRSAPPTISPILLERYSIEERRLSKAALETLSIVAYHQPVTRAEIEEIRGVTDLGRHARHPAGDWAGSACAAAAARPAAPSPTAPPRPSSRHFGLEASRICPASPSCAPRACSTATCRPTSPCPTRPTSPPDARRAAARGRRG